MSLSPAQASALLKEIPVGAPVVVVWFNGFYSCLALATVWAIAAKSGKDSSRLFWFGMVVLMYTVSTIYSTIQAAFEMNTFANHGASPDVIVAFEDAPIWYTALGASLFSLNILIADCIVIWRCWVVWGRNWYIIVLPALTTLAGLVLSILNVIGEVGVVKAKGHVPGKVPQEFLSFNRPYSILTLVTSLYATLFIIFRIYLLQRHVEGAGPKVRFFRRYGKVIELVVESYALYSIVLIAFVILTATGNPKVTFPETILPEIAGIAPTLLIFRVVMGQARPDSSWTSRSHSRTNPDIEFAHSKAEDMSAVGRSTHASDVLYVVPEKENGFVTPTSSGSDSQSSSSKTRVFQSEQDLPQVTFTAS